MSEPPTVEQIARAEFSLKVGGRHVGVEADVPVGPIRLADLLPALHPLANALVEAAEAEAEAQGRAISCRAGCGACCRQPVPIAAAEAVALAELVQAMPEERRTRVVERFEAGLARLAEAGLLDAMRTAPGIADADARQALARAYFRLGIACPFLEDESCSIHRDRPLSCREYLVTSPAEACADPRADTIDLVDVPVRPSGHLFRFPEPAEQGERRATSMLFALEFAEALGEAGSAIAGEGTALFEEFVRGLVGAADPPAGD